MFRTYSFSYFEDDIVMEGTAKIGLFNDGLSVYIDFVDLMLFKEKGGDYNCGCECSMCLLYFKDLIKSIMLARAKKLFVVVEEAEEE